MLFIFSILTTLIIILYLNDENRKRVIDLTINQFINQENNSISIPYEYKDFYSTSIKMFYDKPLLGHGPKTYREVCKEKKYNIIQNHASGEDNCSTHPHNTYMQLIGETGLLGSLPVVIFFFYICINLLQTSLSLIKQKYDAVIILKHFILISIFSTLWPIIPTGNFFNNLLSIFYYFPVGILVYIILNKFKLIK